MAGGTSRFIGEDYDGDGLGDACDPCPLDPTNMSCAAAMSTAFRAAMEYEYWEASCDGLDRYLAEQHIYGNGAQGRIGMYIPYAIRNTSEQVPDPVDGDVYSRKLQKKIYELKDHLGNVRVVLTDLKADNAAGMAAVPGPWGADVRSWQNYYPFGMLQPGRYGDNSINPNRLNYRYGFNGKEMDNEVHENPTTGTVGTGNHYDYGARMYDSRLGRWWRVDAATKKYPSHSPYTYVANSLIVHVEVGGDNWEVVGSAADIGTLTTYISNMFSNQIIAQVDGAGMLRLHEVTLGGTAGAEIDPNSDVGKRYIEKLGDTEKELYKQLSEITYDRSFSVRTDISAPTGAAGRRILFDEYHGTAVVGFEIAINDFDVGVMTLIDNGVPPGTAAAVAKSFLAHSIKEAYTQQILGMHDPTGANGFGYIPSHDYANDQQAEVAGVRIRNYNNASPRLITFVGGRQVVRSTVYAQKKRGWWIFDILVPDDYYKIEIDQDNTSGAVDAIEVSKVSKSEADANSSN